MIRSILASFFLLVLGIGNGNAAKSQAKLTPAQVQGEEIAKKLDLANQGFIGESSDMEMTLIDARGTKVVRAMKGKVREMKEDGDRSLMVFLNPLDVKGTKMLTWAHKSKDDDQWLYLPALRREKRISSSSKTNSFMGSEFSYEDLGSQEREKYHHKLLNEDKTKKEWSLERTPREDSGYSKQVMIISQKYLAATKIDYYNKRGELLKTATFSGHEEYQVKGKKFWRPSKVHMMNHMTKKQSIFTWANRKLGAKFGRAQFEKRSLR